MENRWKKQMRRGGTENGDTKMQEKCTGDAGKAMDGNENADMFKLRMLSRKIGAGDSVNWAEASLTKSQLRHIKIENDKYPETCSENRKKQE
jgi:hypothetical protein